AALVFQRQLGLRQIFQRQIAERKRDGKRCSWLGDALQGAAEHLYALAHAAQAVAFDTGRSQTIVLNLQTARAVLLLQTQAASSSLRVADHIGYAFAHG